MAAGIIGGVAAGGVMDMLGGLLQNFLNSQQREDAEDFIKNHILGRRYQYLVEDLRKAGLNPTMAFGGGASASPGSASAPGVIGAPNIMEGLASGAKDMMSKISQLENTQANTELQKMGRYESEQRAGAAVASAHLDMERAKATKSEILANAAVAREADQRSALLEQQVHSAKIIADWQKEHRDLAGWMPAISAGAGAVGSLGGAARNFGAAARGRP